MKKDNSLPNWLIKSLLLVQKGGGRWIGHLPIIRQILVTLEDKLNNKGLECSNFRKNLVKIIHLTTNNTIFYLDYVNGSDANDGSSWALAWKTITLGATAARIGPTDIIRIAKSPNPTSLGINATWTNLSKTVALASALTANVELCEALWTAVTTNVTQATTATRKEGSTAIQFSIATAFTTGKIAYKTLASTDFSSYQQLSFWIRSGTAITANTLRIVLCSDTIGNTIVDEFIIPAIPSIGRFTPFTINKGSALGSAIQSVAIYAISDPGSHILILDDIIACKAAGDANSLSLTSLISKNSLVQGGVEGWYGIQSINGTTVLLDNDTNTLATAGKGYSGTTETVATYKRETIKTAIAVATTTAIQEIMDSGTLGNNIEFQGGYNTSTTTQDGETFFDGQNGMGIGLLLLNKSYITLNFLNFSRYNYNIYFNGSSNNTITTLNNTNNGNYGIFFSGNSYNNNIITLSNANNNFLYGVAITDTSNNNTINTLSNANNNLSYGVYFLSGSSNNTINTLSNANNNSSGVYFTNGYNNTINTLSNTNNNISYGVSFIYSSNNTIRNLSTSGNGSGGIYNGSTINFLFNTLITEATEVGGFSSFANGSIFSQKHDQSANNHQIFTDGGRIASETTIRHTASGIAWRLSPTSINRQASYPLNLIIAKIACSANNLVTVKAWVRRSNTGLTMRLICRGKQITGVDSDVSASMAAAADTWEELTITFTPTEVGVVEIEAWAYGGTAYNGYIDDMSIAQA